MEKQEQNIINGNTILKLARGPFGFLVILTGCIVVIGKLPPEQFQQVCAFLPYLNSTFGMVLAGLFIFAVFYTFVVKPMAAYFREFIDAYIAKEKEHVKVMQQISGTLVDIEKLIQKLWDGLQHVQTQTERNTQLLKGLKYGRRTED